MMVTPQYGYIPPTHECRQCDWTGGNPKIALPGEQAMCPDCGGFAEET